MTCDVAFFQCNVYRGGGGGGGEAICTCDIIVLDSTRDLIS